jgi:hypothetical protein
MGIATEMKELTKDIASSHEDRVKRLREIREEASQTREEAKDLIKGFQTSRRETGVRLRNELTRDKAQRKSEAKGILKEAQDILRNFTTSRNEMSAQLREELSKGMADRRSEVRETLKDAEKSIRGFKVSRKKMGSEVRKELGQSRSRAKSEVGQLLGNAQALVKDFGRSRREESNRLRKELAKNRAERESDVKRMQSDFGKARSNLKGELQEAAGAWRELVGMKAQPRAKVREPKGVPKARIPGRIADLEAKLLAAVNEHPEGITLTEVADSLGVASVLLGRASRRLLRNGEIRKKEKFYFPVAGK